MTPSILTTPNQYAPGSILSIIPTDGSGDLSVVRATSATRVDANGLVEIPRTNLLTYSEQFDNAIWTKTGSTITANSTTAPNGTLTADTINISVQDVERVIQRVLTGVSITGITYRASIWVKGQGTNIGKLVRFRVKRNSGGSMSDAIINHTLTSDWVRISIGFTGIADNTGVSFGFDGATGYADSFDVWGAQLEQGVSATEYIPTVASIRTKFAGITQDGSSASNIPRLDYTNGSCPSILVEPQRTNLLLRSEEFDNASWTKNNAPTITSNIAIAPDGTTSADGIQSLTGGAYRSISQNITVASNSTVTGSVFVKKETSETFYGGFSIVFQGGTTKTLYIIVDAVVGTGTISSSTLTGIIKVEDYGNYWRISATTTDNGSNTICKFSYESTLSTNGTTLNVGAGSVRTIWGAQLEAGANATSYIPTTSASVTRNADVISKTGISSLIGQTEGTLFLDTKYLASTTASGRWFNVFGTTNHIGLALNGSNFVRTIINNASDTITTAPKTNLNIKIAFAYNATGVVLFINGVQYALPNGGSQIITSLNSIAFDPLANSQLQTVDINLLALWKERLSNETLAQLTTI
jgi:hypothetical protein